MVLYYSHIYSMHTRNSFNYLGWRACVYFCCIQNSLFNNLNKNRSWLTSTPVKKYTRSSSSITANTIPNLYNYHHHKTHQWLLSILRKSSLWKQSRGTVSRILVIQPICNIIFMKNTIWVNTIKSFTIVSNICVAQ